MPGAPTVSSDILVRVTDVDTQTTKPAADSTANVTLADVVGSKDDTAYASSSSTTQQSLMARVKGILSVLGVATADSTSNGNARDAIGNKSDAAQTTVGTTRSIMAYVKGILGFFTATSSITSPVLVNNTSEQDLVDFTGLTAPRRIIVGVGAVNLTQDSTLRVHEAFDGANYAENVRLRQALTAGQSAGYDFFTSAPKVKVTIQPAVAPGTPQLSVRAYHRGA